MSIRKKLLIALLTATVSVAGIASIAACKNDDNPPNPNPGGSTDITVTVSDEAYEIATANGQTGTKDEWLGSLKTTYEINGKKIKSVAANTDGNVIITFTDNSAETVTMSVKIYKIVCKDNITGALLEGAWFEIGYIDGTFTYTDSVSNRYAQSGEDGVAAFYVTPEEGINYTVRIAHDADALASYLGISTAPSILPDKYETAFGTNNGFPVTNLRFGDSRTIEAMFVNSANNFYKADKTKIPYSRTDKSETNGTLNGGFKIKASEGVYNYIYFNPYVSPSNADDANAAVAAAAGTYKFTVTPASEATLYKFNGTLNYTPLNANDIPAIAEYVTGGAEGGDYDNGDYDNGVYTGTNSITLNITRSISQADNLFGILTTSDCEVTLTVERTGDAEEEIPVEVTTVPVPSGITQYPAKPENTSLTLMPVSGSLDAVLGDDGFYHVGTKDGPRLLVQLNKALPRVSSIAISKAPEDILPGSSEPRGDSALTFTVRENGKVKEILNYANVIAAYSAKANDDGVYGVDETLYKFLKVYGASAQAIGTVIGSEYNWLLPCQYYQPSSGLQVTGSGTEDDPYVLISGANGVDVYGTAYLSFTAPEDGIYTFKITNGAIICTSGASTYDYKNVLNVCATAENREIKLVINGTGANTVTVNYIDAENRNISASYNDDTQVTLGTEDNPVALLPNISNIIITSANEEGVWVNFGTRALLNATTYVLELYDDNALIYYNGEEYSADNPLTLTLENSEMVYKLLITAKDGDGNVIYGNFMLNARVPDPNALKVGDNNISFGSSGETYEGKVYSFTSRTGGVYTLKVAENSNALITNDDFSEDYVNAETGVLSYAFKVEAGQTVKFRLSMREGTEFVLTVEEGGLYNDPTPLTLRITRDLFIPVGSEGYDNTIAITSAGTYSVKIEVTNGSTDEIIAGYKLNNMPVDLIELQRNGNVLTGKFELTDADMRLVDGGLTFLLVAEQAESPVTVKLTIQPDADAT